jgi:hypothetical protein
MAGAAGHAAAQHLSVTWSRRRWTARPPRCLTARRCAPTSSPAAAGADAREGLLAGDASFRKYFPLEARERHGRGHGFARGARTRGTVRANWPTPAQTRSQRAGNLPPSTRRTGFLLVEDLGDDTSHRVLEAGGDEAELYTRATDVLVALHAAPAHGLLPASRLYR